LAGLLTYSIFETPFPSFVSDSGIEYCSKTFGGAYSSGSVQDSHLIPFSVFLPNERNTTKIRRKGTVLFWYSKIAA
jgi:hypothetical protein